MGKFLDHETLHHFMILPLVIFLLFSRNVTSFALPKTRLFLQHSKWNIAQQVVPNPRVTFPHLPEKSRFLNHLKLSMNQNTDFISHELSSNDISHVKILPRVFLPQEEIEASQSPNYIPPQDSFASIFSHSAPYIAMHRGSTIVLHLSGAVLNNKNIFDRVIDDIAILHLLGVKLVLVIGVRDRMDAKMISVGEKPVYRQGMRITDDIALKHLKEEAGSARFELESALSRGIRGIHSHSSLNGGVINVVSGNFFYTAKPLGVREGVDFK